MIEIREHTIRSASLFVAPVGSIRIEDVGGLVAEYEYEDTAERRAALEDAREEAAKLAAVRADQIRDHCTV